MPMPRLTRLTSHRASDRLFTPASAPILGLPRGESGKQQPDTGPAKSRIMARGNVSGHGSVTVNIPASIVCADKRPSRGRAKGAAPYLCAQAPAGQSWREGG